MDLGSLNIDALENIINSLSQKDIEQLSSFAQSFSSSSGGAPDEGAKKENGQDIIQDAEMIEKIMLIMRKLSKQRQDPRCELLTALKPMLSPQKRKKADEAINMLRVLSILPIIDELKE